MPPPQAPRAQASRTPLAWQPKVALASAFRKTEANAASRAVVWIPPRREYGGFCDALGTVEAHGPWTVQFHAQASLRGSGLQASTWLCPEMATGGTLEFGGAPVQKPQTEWLVCNPVGLPAQCIITTTSAMRAVNVDCPSVPDSPKGAISLMK